MGLHIIPMGHKKVEIEDDFVSVYDANGNRIGTCRKDPYGRTLRLYDNNDKLVKNPEMYINISDDENYLFGVSGHVIGKYNSTRVFIFHNTSP